MPLPDPAPGMLTTVTDDEIVAAARRYLPLVGEISLRTSVTLFRQICAQNNVALLKATPNDFAVIRSRPAIGWTDDRP